MYEGGDQQTAAPDSGCHLFDLELAAYLEGEERPKLTAHVQECAFCYRILADLQGIRSASSELATEEPPARLWANIRASLLAEGIIRSPEAPWRRWSWAWIAGAWLNNPMAVAALAGLLILGIGLLKSPGFGIRGSWFASRNSGFGVQASGQVLPNREPRAPNPVDWSAVTNAAVALGPMETSYRARAVSFEPSLQETYRKSLDSLDGQIRECLESVKQEPDNSLAREYLLAAYEQKAYVLESALYVEGR
jgi:hypothetical protein